MRDLSGVVAALKKQRQRARLDLEQIDRAIVALGGAENPVGRPAKAANPPARPRRRMSAEARKIASDRMKTRSSSA